MGVRLIVEFLCFLECLHGLIDCVILGLQDQSEDALDIRLVNDAPFDVFGIPTQQIQRVLIVFM